MAAYLGIGSRVRHPDHGQGVVTALNADGYTITFMNEGGMHVPYAYGEMVVIDRIEPRTDVVSFRDVTDKLKELLERYNGLQEEIHLGEKWRGGTVIMKPGASGLKDKEIPVETFFHKIVMVRDRLRVMEQKINASKNLQDDEKVELQQYITRIYGSLTTFNVLFKLKEDYFVGEKSS